MKYVVELKKTMIVEADSPEDAETEAFNCNEIIAEEEIISIESEQDSTNILLEFVL